MYLHGMSSGDFVPALEEFFGSAAGLSASVITRLTTDWQKEREQFAHRSLKDADYVYLFADGIVRHEAPTDRVGGKDPPATCRSRLLKLEAA
jgi:transposase-like protein